MSKRHLIVHLGLAATLASPLAGCLSLDDDYDDYDDAIECGIDDDGPQCQLTGNGEIAAPGLVSGQGRAQVMTSRGRQTLEFDVIDGQAVFEGDIDLGPVDQLDSQPKGAGREARSYRWPDRVVPFVIDPALHPTMVSRVQSAIQHWEASTNIDLVPRTSQSNYVEFVNSNRCSSQVGRVGGRQTINLTTGKSAFNIVDVAISKFNDWVYVWYDDGYVTAGTSVDLDSRLAQYPYSLPPGYSYSQIVGMGIAPGTNRVYTWYANGRYTIGDSADLDRYQAPASFSLPSGYSVSQIRAMAIADSDSHVYVWYSNGRVSSGSSSDLDRYRSPYSYSLPPGVSNSQIAGLAISSSDRTYAWYTNGMTSAGSTSDLDSAIAPIGYNPPASCSTGAVIHEIGHAVGLWHEQSRCDRNSFVTVLWGNIQSGQSHNFDNYCGSDGRDLASFDFGSIMLYGSFSFSTNGNPTIVRASDGSTFNAQRSGLSMGDLQSVTELYGYSPAAGQTPADIVGVGIAGSNDYVYAWHRDGTVSAGHTFDHDDRIAGQTYTPAAGRSYAQIVAVAIAGSSDHVYAWYSDGTVSSGDARDLDRYASPYAYSLPPGKTWADVVDIAIAPNDRVYAFYTDNTVSVGTTSDLDAHGAPSGYSPAAGYSASDIVGIGIAGSNSQVWAWYDDSSVSSGTSADLDVYQQTW